MIRSENSINITSDLFLNKACTELGFYQGAGFYDLSIEMYAQKDDSLNKSQWLILAKQLDAEKVFFIDDFPVVLFFKFNTNVEEQVFHLHKKMWNMSRAPLFFVALPGELRLYSSYEKPIKTLEEWNKQPRWLERVQDIARIAGILSYYSRTEIESESFFEYAGSRIERRNRADAWLLKNLKLLRKELEEVGLGRRLSHALIGRSIFIRYLEDRKVLVEEYFLSTDLSNGKCKNYCDILASKEFTYKLFRKLRKDFNGDMFPITAAEESEVTSAHLSLLRDFLLEPLPK